MKGIGEVKKIILVMSGKGGVGKSTFSVLLARYLEYSNKKVGLLDLDLCGPSIGKMVSSKCDNICVTKGFNDEWKPVKLSENLCAVSMSYFLENHDNAIIWRGPKKNAMIKELIENVEWNDLDYLIVDTPPGTSDEHITLAEFLYGLSNVGVILVTTPQKVAINDVRREITFCHRTTLNIIGIVENMSFFVCPKCQHQNKLLNADNESGALKLSIEFNIKLLGSLPYCYTVCANLDLGRNPFDIDPNESGDNNNNCHGSYMEQDNHDNITNSYNVFMGNFKDIINNINFI